MPSVFTLICLPSLASSPPGSACGSCTGFKGDWVIILANSVGFALVAVPLVFKIRDAQWFAKATAETP
jgi:hypothetical protein